MFIKAPYSLVSAIARIARFLKHRFDVTIGNMPFEGNGMLGFAH